MTSWTRWSKGLLVCGAASLAAGGCLLEDPNMDGILSMTGTGSNPDDTSTPPGTADGTATLGDTETPPTGEAPMGTTIYDIQMGAISPDTLVDLEGVVVVSPVQVEDGGVIVQDPMGGPYSAIYLYLFDEVVMGVPLAPGDVLNLSGTYTEFFDFSEITIADAGDIQITGSAAVPAPADISSADIAPGSSSAEQYESVPVCLSGVSSTDATNQFGDFHIDDGVVVSNFFLFGGDDVLDVPPGTEFSSLCGPVLYNFGDFKVAPRSPDDWDASVAPCDDAASSTTIADIQQGMFATGSLVRVQDVVVTTPWTVDQDVFWVQDPAGGQYSGIAVYMPSAGGFVPSPGDVVTLCGSYAEFFEQSQIQIGDAANVTAGGSAAVPAPEVLTPDEVGMGAMAEAWEGVLVRVENTTVTEAPDANDEWTVDDVLVLTPEFFANGWPMPMIDDPFASLTGVMIYSFEEYKLAPRDAADLVP